MKNRKKHKSTHKSVQFISAWDELEKPINIIDDSSLELYMTNDEIGVIQSNPSTIDFIKDQAAFLFGEGVEDLIFRASFGCFIKIPNNDVNKKEICERLFKSRFASFCNASSLFSSKTEHGIPVYVNALSMIFQVKDKEDESDGTFKNELLLPLEMNELFYTDNEANGRQDVLPVNRMKTYDGESQTTVDIVVKSRGGQVYARFRSEDNRLYSFDFIMIDNRFFIVIYVNLFGDWLADEEKFNEDPPLWFSDENQRISPVFQAMKSYDFFKDELPDIKIDLIVVLPCGCTIINEEDVQECWKEECHTAVVYTKKRDVTSLMTLWEYITSLPIISIKAQQLDTNEVNDIISRFIMNSENWINE